MYKYQPPGASPLPIDATEAMIALTIHSTTLKKTKVVQGGRLITLKQQLVDNYNQAVGNKPSTVRSVKGKQLKPINRRHNRRNNTEDSREGREIYQIDQQQPFSQERSRD